MINSERGTYKSFEVLHAHFSPCCVEPYNGKNKCQDQTTWNHDIHPQWNRLRHFWKRRMQFMK